MENQLQQSYIKRFGISGSTIKIIAIISMAIDHVAAAILGRYLVLANTDSATSGIGQYVPLQMNYEMLSQLYQIMRLTGRLGFPIFCFLLIEGFEHTRDVKKYATRLAIFALISEVPFDLVFHGKMLEFSNQNVFFTLFIGLLTMCAFRFFENALRIPVVIRLLGSLASLMLGMGAAYLLHTDYAETGVLCIIIIYVLRKHKVLQIVGGALAFSWELTAPLAFIPIALYNGKRGINMKYFFYAFYPAHLLIIYLICLGLGIGPVSVM